MAEITAEQGVTNLVRNGSFEAWPASGAPDYWTFAGAGGSVAKDATYKKYGAYSARLTRAGADVTLRQDISAGAGSMALAAAKGKRFTAAVWARKDASKQGRIGIDDGIGLTWSGYACETGEWDLLTVTRTVSLQATKVEMVLQVYSVDGAISFDGAAIYQGTDAPDFAPNPSDTKDPINADTSAPAVPTGLAATPAPLTIILTWNANSETDIYGYDLQRANDSGFTTGLITFSMSATRHTDTPNTLSTRYYRIRAFRYSGATSDWSAGVSTAAQGLDPDDFETGIRPIQIVGSLPSLPDAAYPQGALVFLTTDNKLYRSTGSTWTAAVPTADLTGQVTSVQIQDGAIAQVKMASGLRVPVIVSGLPGLPDANYPQGALVFLTTDNKLYRSTGSTWTAAVPTSDLSGQITTTQITDNAVTTDKINANAVTAAKIAADTITAGQIAAGAIGTDELAAGAVITAKLAAGAVTANEISSNAVTSDKIYAGAVTAAKIASSQIESSHLRTDVAVITATAQMANSIITSAKIGDAQITNAKIGNLEVDSAKIANLTIGTGKIAAGAVSTDAYFVNNDDTSTITSETEVGSLTISTDGGTVMVHATVNYVNGDSWILMRLRKDSISGTVLTWWYILYGQIPATMFVQDDSPSSSQTYKLTADLGGGTWLVVNNRRIYALNRKK